MAIEKEKETILRADCVDFLNGISPSYSNNIVLGGWFIGITAIFYLLFPALINILKKGIELFHM